MKLQRFNLYEDLEHINAWLIKRGHAEVTRHDLPEMGYVAWHNGRCVASVFLRRCEGRLGIIDGLASNPDIQPEIRHVALDALIKHIVEQAKKAKYKYVMGFTTDSNTFNRSIRLGFTESDYKTVVNKLD